MGRKQRHGQREKEIGVEEKRNVFM